jgi:hypothetical protein
MQKALWLTAYGSGDFDKVLDRAHEAEATLLCIRTTSSALPAAIPKFRQKGISVYGWRWPAVVNKPYTAPHYFAMAEAEYVVSTLLPAGLDGYIVDPESDGPGQVDDWNDSQHIQLAIDFCAAIRDAAKPGFHFGVTSGCQYPTNHSKIPWAAFVAAADALYPQTYWRTGHTPLHGGTPAAALAQGMTSWSTIAMGKPIVAIGGEIASVLPAEITDFGALILEKQSVAHFYADSATPAVLKAIAAI